MRILFFAGEVLVEIAFHFIREIRAQIGKLKEWIADLFKARETAPEQPPQSPNLANLLMKYLSVQREKSRKYSQRWQRQHATDELKTIAAAVNYLSEHGISNLDELDASLSSVSDKAYSIREGMKTAEERMKKLQKLWEPYIPFGKVTIVQGNPGEGKTTFALRLAAACTTGGTLPGMKPIQPFQVIYQTAEDGLGDTVKPRLIEAEADLDRVAPYIDPVFDNNILLTQTERLTMNNRPKDPKTARNKNVLVIGGSGSGKTRFFVKPNLMQCVSKDYPTSFVITDPKGSLIGEVGQLLVRCGYRVKVLNTINFSKSMRYNPFRYIHSEKDILKLVNTLICNTKGEGEKSAEDFWIKSERLLYSALIGYIWYEAPDEEMNFTTLLEMINASEAREDDPEFQSPVDQMFERLEEKDPEHFAVRQYRKFLLSAGKTRSSILISCGARLAPFDIREVRELMEDDELELDTIGDQKTALFLIMSDTDTTFNFILAMVQSQLINLLCDRADDKYGGRLPVHVRLILDEFANIGQIPNFDKLIATIRSREISASIILQSQSQLKAIYKDAAEIISDNCDCTLFLSGRGKNAKEIAEVLGKETIDSYNQSENRGAQTSHGLNYQKLGKELMSQDEIATMDGGKCILQVRGVRPFFSEKYDITRHPRYQYLSDADKKNTFDVDSYLSSLRRKKRRVVTEDEPFDLYDIELSEEDFAAE